MLSLVKDSGEGTELYSPGTLDVLNVVKHAGTESTFSLWSVSLLFLFLCFSCIHVLFLSILHVHYNHTYIVYYVYLCMYNTYVHIHGYICPHKVL